MNYAFPHNYVLLKLFGFLSRFVISLLSLPYLSISLETGLCGDSPLDALPLEPERTLKAPEDPWFSYVQGPFHFNLPVRSLINRSSPSIMPLKIAQIIQRIINQTISPMSKSSISIRPSVVPTKRYNSVLRKPDRSRGKVLRGTARVSTQFCSTETSNVSINNRYGSGMRVSTQYCSTETEPQNRDL